MVIKRKTKIIMIIFIALFFMTIGFSSLNERLRFTGTAEITSSFKIKFTSVKSSSVGLAYNIKEPNITDDKIIFRTGLNAPGDIMNYELTVKNTGTLSGYLDDIVIEDSNNPAIIVYSSGIVKGEALCSGCSKVIYITVEFDRDITSPPENLETDFSIRLNYAQDVNNIGTTTSSCFTTNSTGEQITGYDISCGLDVLIPNEINDVIITSIGKRAFSGLGINSVNIPNTVTTIESKAFYKNNLTTVIIPDSVTTIGYRAFEDNLISTLVMSDTNITSIDYAAFVDNRLPSDVAFIYNRNSDGTINKASLNSYAGEKRDYVIIPDNVRTITKAAFYNTDIEEVVMPEGLTTIGDEAFIYNHLKHVNIPSSVTSIGLMSFNANQVKTEDGPFIYKHNSDGSIDETKIISYAGVKNENVIIPEGIITIDDYAFYDTGIRTITLPQSLEIIETAAFRYCWFVDVTIPSKVTKIGKGAFLKDDVSNKNLVKIVNTTGNAFDWGRIVNGETTNITYVTGEVESTYGNVVISE